MNAKSVNLLFALPIVGFCSLFASGANAQSVGGACAVNGRTQMSATASEGLIQCRSGTWASASQTVSSGGSSTPITAIMQYEKTLVTTVDACTDAMVGFKAFNPDTGQTMICAGASRGWRYQESFGMSVDDKCTAASVKSGGEYSFTGTKMDGCNTETFCIIKNPRRIYNNEAYYFSSSRDGIAADKFCKSLGFRGLRSYKEGCSYTQQTSGVNTAEWNDSTSTWNHIKGSGQSSISSNFSCY